MDRLGCLRLRQELSECVFLQMSRNGLQGLQVGLTVHEIERQLIMKTLEACRGNGTEAAAMLGISTRTLRNKLHEYGAMDAFKNDDDKSSLQELVAETA